jgi:N-methylhydantoinase A
MEGYHIGVDIGGTFTDIILLDPSGKVRSHKLLSTPDDYSRAMVEGILEICVSAGIQPSMIDRLVHGTTVVTNACIEMKGAKVGLLTTSGFRDILEIGRGRLPAVLDLSWNKPPPLVPRNLRLEVEERIDGRGNIIQALDILDAEKAIRQLLDEGIEAIAVCLLNSPANSQHEIEVAKIARRLAPSIPLSVSSDVMPMFSEYERTSEAVLNAYVMPLVKRYLTSVQLELGKLGIDAPLYIMQSSGGMTTPENAMARPIEIIECGPAAGVVGAMRLSTSIASDLITFDMGGTTAKASIVEAGNVSRAAEYEVGGGLNRASRLLKGAGYVVRVASIDIAEIGAGGGSVLSIDAGGGIAIGPESAGAKPGPACYGLGGVLPTVADADLILGYINPRYLCGDTYPLDIEAARKAIGQTIAPKLGITEVEAAFGVYQLANARMMRAIRAVSSERGRDPRQFSLHAFGGAGPIHAAGVADGLGMQRIIVPPAPGVFSAFGLLTGDVERHFTRSFNRSWDTMALGDMSTLIRLMEKEARSSMSIWAGRASDKDLVVSRFLDLQYAGQGSSLSIEITNRPIGKGLTDDIAMSFEQLHERTFGHHLPKHPIRATALRLTACIAAQVNISEVNFEMPTLEISMSKRPAYWGPTYGLIDTPVHSTATIGEGLSGPVLIDGYDTTIVVPPGAQVVRGRQGGVIIDLQSGA